MQKTSFWKTGVGFATFVLCGACAVVLCMFVLVLMRDADQHASFGLSKKLAKQFAGMYAPVVTATLIGFRRVLFTGVAVGVNHKPDVIVIRYGANILYVTAALGLFGAFAALVVASIPALTEHAEGAAGVAAAFWAGTLGYILERFFTTQERRVEVGAP